MSEAEELLDSLTDGSTDTPETLVEPHIVVNPDRSITVPVELKRIAVQYDHNIETVTFDCPRYWDGHDMSKMAVYVNYKTADNTLGSYMVDDVTTDTENDDIMHFTWTISRDVTKVKGTIAFLVCVKKADDDGYETNHWNSELSKDDMYVSEGLECEVSVIDRYPAIITQLLTRMQSVEDLPPTVQVVEVAEGYDVTLNDINGSTTIKLLHGAVFIPSVTGGGTLSWTNDRGLENPVTVNIRGPKGELGGTLDRNSGKEFTVFIGTMEEWNNWIGPKEDVLFFPTDDTTIEDIQNRLDTMFATTEEVRAIFSNDDSAEVS